MAPAVASAMAPHANAAALPQAAAAALHAGSTGAALPASAQALAPAPAQVAFADRPAVANAMSLPAATTAPAAPGAAAGTTAAASLAVPAAGNPQAASLAAMPAPAAPLAPAHADARGNPMLAGGPAQGRGDGVAQAHGHTVAAAARRSRLGGDTPGRGRGIDHALALLGLGHARRKEEQDIRELAERTFGRLYWLLTITAWACVGVMVMVVALPMFGGLADASPLLRHNPLAWIGVLGTLGLGAGLGAWWLTRRTR